MFYSILFYSNFGELLPAQLDRNPLKGSRFGVSLQMQQVQRIAGAVRIWTCCKGSRFVEQLSRFGPAATRIVVLSSLLSWLQVLERSSS
jgi:hypothetical protein